MKIHLKKPFFLLILSLLFTVFVSGQVESSSAGNSNQSDRKDRAFANLNSMMDNRRGGDHSDEEKEKAVRELVKQYKRTKNLLLPSDLYYKKYSVLINDKKLELARIRSDKNCGHKLVISFEESERCVDAVPVYGEGSFYSFVNKVNYLRRSDVFRLKYGIATSGDEYSQPDFRYYSSNEFDAANNWWNVHLKDNRLEAAGNLIQGVIANIGPTDLGDLDLTSPTLKFFNDYQPGKTVAEADSQNKLLQKGIVSDNFIYSNTTEVKAEHTYILRSILYPFKPDYMPDKRTNYTAEGMDITVAFQIVGQENDGSIIVLWKELKKTKLRQKYKL